MSEIIPITPYKELNELIPEAIITGTDRTGPNGPQAYFELVADNGETILGIMVPTDKRQRSEGLTIGIKSRKESPAGSSAEMIETQQVTPDMSLVDGDGSVVSEFIEEHRNTKRKFERTIGALSLFNYLEPNQ